MLAEILTASARGGSLAPARSGWASASGAGCFSVNARWRPCRKRPIIAVFSPIRRAALLHARRVRRGVRDGVLATAMPKKVA